MTPVPVLAVIVSMASVASPCVAQAPGVEVFEQSDEALEREEELLGEQVASLAAVGDLLAAQKVRTQLRRPVPRRLDLLSRAVEAASPARVAERAKLSQLRVGWCYLCADCEHWHTDLAAGYAITTDGAVATCAHVLEPPAYVVGKGSLIAVDHLGVVRPVRAVLACDPVMDAAIVDLAVELQALPLDHDVRPGDASFCFSRPFEERGYFSGGIVNRFYWDSLDRGGDDSALRALAHLRLNVSTDWAPGSSGAAILDRHANVIGHVAGVLPFGVGIAEPESEQADGTDAEAAVTIGDLEGAIPMITMHVAIPARSVRALAEQCSVDAIRRDRQPETRPARK